MTRAAAQTNRRLTSRQTCLLSARYLKSKDWHPATAMDLSVSGCRLRLGEDLPRGAAVSVAFAVPGEVAGQVVAAEVSGHVIWSRLEGLSHQAGIQFSSSKRALEEILATIR